MAVLPRDTEVQPYPAPAPGRGPGPSAVLSALRRDALRIGLLAVAGGVLAFLAAALRPATYRAEARVLVVEPRLAAGAPLVDFNLTPIRSYTALFTSRASCEPCLTALAPEGAEAALSRLKVKVPENTRLLELSFADRDPRRAAAFLTCVAARAVDENRRLNAELGGRMVATIASALEAARADVKAISESLAEERRTLLLELKRQQLKTALAELDGYSDAARDARIALAESQARRTSYEETAKGRPRTRRLSGAVRAGDPGAEREEADPTRDAAEREGADAAADQAAARAAVAEAERGRAAAETRARGLEKEIASGEERVAALRRRLDAVSQAQTELERRSASAPLEAAGKAFELALVAPAVPPTSPAGPPPLLAALAGVVTGAALGAVLALSRP